MSGKRCITYVALAVLMIVLSLPSQVLATDEITIGLIPELNVFAQTERFRALADYLKEKAGIEVKLTILSKYGDIITKFEERHMDGAFFGSFTGAMAIHKLGLQPIARPVNLDGTASYKGYLFVRRDSGIRDIKSMKGKKLALVSKSTTAGYFFPIEYLREHGVENWEDYFSSVIYTGSHDAAIHSVLTGESDVGAAKNTVYNILRSKNINIDKALVILAESVEVPSNGLCVRPTMDPALKTKLKDTLLSMDEDPEGQEALKKFFAYRFIETTVDDYKPVFEMIENAGFDIQKIESEQ